MNTHGARMAVILAAISASLQAREIQTPLPLYRGPIHYPFELERDPVSCFGWNFDFWGAGYSRSIKDAFGPGFTKDCRRPNNNSCSGCPTQVPSATACGNSNRIELTQLLFGKADFTLAQAFAQATVSPFPANETTNPFVSIATLSPRFDYHEQGAFFGMTVGKRFGCDDRLTTGVRIRLPYRDVDMEEQCPGDAISSEGGNANTGESLQDVYRTRQESILVNSISGIRQNPTFAARLDFLSALNAIGFTSTGGVDPLVKYNDSNAGGQFTIGGQPIAGNITNITPPVAGIQSNSGLAPVTVRWADTPQNSATVINGDGSGLGNLARGHFAPGTGVYTALSTDPAAQSMLWIVPDVEGGDLNPSAGVLIGAANGVANAIQAAVNNLIFSNVTSVTPFLQSHGISFCNGGRQQGLGDLDIEWYLGYEYCDDYWAELQIGLRLPTAKRVLNSLQVLNFPLGNNGHVEIRPGIGLGFEHWEKIKLHANLMYSFVLKRTEHLPAAFTGAQVLNIGPDVLGDVSWSYFWGNIFLTFLHPCDDDCGFTVGYEAYVKQKDKICFCVKKAPDFNGNLQTLDGRLLSCYSDRVAHKIRAEIFLIGKCADVFAGFSQVIAGKNITRDLDMYIGLNIKF